MVRGRRFTPFPTKNASASAAQRLVNREETLPVATVPFFLPEGFPDSPLNIRNGVPRVNLQRAAFMYTELTIFWPFGGRSPHLFTSSILRGACM